MATDELQVRSNEVYSSELIAQDKAYDSDRHPLQQTRIVVK